MLQPGLLRSALPLLTLLLVAITPVVRADLELEATGQVESVPQPPAAHWAWAGDPVLGRSALVDLDSGAILGSVGATGGIPALLLPRTRPEVYTVQTHHARGDHGERTDVLVFYDARRLLPIAEVVMPPKRAILAFDTGTAALSDDERFAAVFNLTPATSLSIVDVQERRLAGEISTPGCSLVYPAGPQRFAMLCGNGALLLLDLDADGNVLDRERSAPFFDPEADPVTEKAVRWGATWLFVSFEGYVHPVDLSGAAPRFGERWSLLSDADREASWRVGGSKHLAVHQATGRLYSIMHQGGPDTHKDAGTEIWVYDLAARRRVQRIEAAGPGPVLLGRPLDTRNWIWPFDRLASWLLAGPPTPVDEVQVTQDAEPLLVTSAAGPFGLVVHDARSGAFLRRVTTGNMANLGLLVPDGWAGSVDGGAR